MSQVTAKKSLNISSATGRSPVIAAPIAAPTIACSLIGVSLTRSGPNSSNRPSVSLKTPPAEPTSSPISTTVSSRRISWAMPWATAWRYVVSAMTGRSVPPGRAAVGPDLRLDDVRRRLRPLSRLGLGRGDLRRGGFVDRVQLGGRDAGGLEPRAVRRDRVACLPRGHLVVRPVLAGIGAGVPAVAVRHGLDERRPVAASRPLDRRPRDLVDRVGVVPVDDDRLEPVGGRPVRRR